MSNIMYIMLNTLYILLFITVSESVVSYQSDFVSEAIISNISETDRCPNVKSSVGLARKRRHLNFPDGSNVVLTISLVKAIMVHAPSGWNIALEIDVAYPLPNAKFSNAHRRRNHHRQKREFWETLKNAIDLHNLNGKSCIIKSVCEAKYHLAPKGQSLVHDLLRAIFTVPTLEKDFAEEITGSYDELLDEKICDKISDCPFSILHFVLMLNKQN